MIFFIFFPIFILIKFSFLTLVDTLNLAVECSLSSGLIFSKTWKPDSKKEHRARGARARFKIRPAYDADILRGNFIIKK